MSRSPMDELKAYSESLMDSVSATTTETAVMSAMRGVATTRTPLRQRLTTVSVVAATFLSANVGLAAAAQNAAPGDLLYGVDRAYELIVEFVGIDNERTEERIDEASELADRGEVAAALAAASSALESLGASLSAAEAADIAEATSDLGEAGAAMSDLPPATDDAQPAFVTDVIAETQLLLDLVEQVRLAAKDGEPGDAAEAAKALKDQAKKVADAAKQNGKSADAPGQTGDTPGLGGDIPGKGKGPDG